VIELTLTGFDTRAPSDAGQHFAIDVPALLLSPPMPEARYIYMILLRFFIDNRTNGSCRLVIRNAGVMPASW